MKESEIVRLTRKLEARIQGNFAKLSYRDLWEVDRLVTKLARSNAIKSKTWEAMAKLRRAAGLRPEK